MDSLSNEAYVYFGIFGDFDRDSLSRQIGIQPTCVMAKGERNPKHQLPRTSIWEYSSARVSAEAIDVGALAEELVSDLEPVRGNIAPVLSDQDLKATLQVVIYFSSNDDVSTPAIGFSHRVLEFLAEVGACIDVDTYIR